MAESSPYRVLARKYRPQTFAELIGQDAMVQTLGNAIRRGRLAHAFLLTGVRGVGKTSTARLIAKALNCVGPDGTGGPTISPCGVCEPCVAITDGRYIDVIEMDAASHTGVDDMRSVIDISKVASFSARFKIFIIDEVHMLSKNAFNALLKTLEEPAAGVKFILATTEIEKVPVTVLSRCQRFDLRRIPAETLQAHFARVVHAEDVEAEPEALALVARAAEGSARDGLSILDQAIAHGAGGVTAAQVREMLGLSDRGAVRTLFGRLLAGDAGGVLERLGEQHALGVDPASLLRGLLEVVHGVTRTKVGGAADPALSEEERAAFAEWASRLGFSALHRLWQLLLKGHAEVQTAILPREAAEMALLRVVHASTLPDPGELARRIVEGALPSPSPLLAPAERGQLPPPPPGPASVGSYTELLERLERGGRHAISARIADCYRLVEFSPPTLELAPVRPMEADAAQRERRDIGDAVKEVTGERWTITFSVGKAAQPTRHEANEAAFQAYKAGVLEQAVVKAAYESFPDAVLDEEHLRANWKR